MGKAEEERFQKPLNAGLADKIKVQRKTCIVSSGCRGVNQRFYKSKLIGCKTLIVIRF